MFSSVTKFEAHLVQGSIVKNELEALRDLIKETAGKSAQWCEPAEHGTFSHLTLSSKDFLKYHCDHILVMSEPCLHTKILKCVDNKDIITLRAEDNRGALVIRSKAPNLEKDSGYGMKLMN